MCCLALHSEATCTHFFPTAVVRKRLTLPLRFLEQVWLEELAATKNCTLPHHWPWCMGYNWLPSSGLRWAVPLKGLFVPMFFNTNKCTIFIERNPCTRLSFSDCFIIWIPLCLYLLPIPNHCLLRTLLKRYCALLLHFWQCIHIFWCWLEFIFNCNCLKVALIYQKFGGDEQSPKNSFVECQAICFLSHLYPSK